MLLLGVAICEALAVEHLPKLTFSVLGPSSFDLLIVFALLFGQGPKKVVHLWVVLVVVGFQAGVGHCVRENQILSERTVMQLEPKKIRTHIYTHTQ